MRAILLVLAALAGLAVAPAQAIAGGASKIIFINRCVGGCTIARGDNNAIDNTSVIPQGDPGQVFTIPEFAHGDAAWNAMFECVRQVYSPYDVEVVDVDPGNVPHHEVMASGRDADIGQADALGLAGSYNIGCDPTDNIISFAFLNDVAATRTEFMCQIVAQESAHSFGLPDHIYDCTDPMTYLTITGNTCGRAFFRNKPMPCGEWQLSGTCTCGGSRANTHAQLSTVFGPGVQPPPPTVSFTYPAEGAQIGSPPIFEVAATDPRGVFRVEIFLNGWLWDSYDAPTSITPPFSWPDTYPIVFTEEVPPGVIDVEARAYNDLGLPGAFDQPSFSTATLQVNNGPPCTSADECFAGQRCDAGRCLWDQPVGELGDACEYDQYCVGENTYDGHCEDVGAGPVCTYACVAGINDACPEGHYCPGEEGDEGFCAPGTGDEEPPGCCSTGGSRASILLALLVGLALFRRRAR